jgi:hypothetical protein
VKPVRRAAIQTIAPVMIAYHTMLHTVLESSAQCLEQFADMCHRQAVSLAKKQQTRRYRPPLNAAFLFYLFLTPQNCDALVGDLEERFKLILRKFGRRRANFWYWTQTLMSVGPIVWAWAKKVSMKPVVGIVTWAVAKGLLGHDSWMAALVELWKRVQS